VPALLCSIVLTKSVIRASLGKRFTHTPNRSVAEEAARSCLVMGVGSERAVKRLTSIGSVKGESSPFGAEKAFQGWPHTDEG